jgi:hypothetical protein
MRHFRWMIALLIASTSMPLAAQEEVTFHRRASRTGDQSRQSLNCDLDLTMSIRQSGQIVQSQQQLVQRQQDRQLTILQASPDGAPQQAQVKYENSTVSLRSAEQPPQVSRQPVTGKTYRVTRQADELEIVYPDGSAPPDEERLIVRENMDTFGLPNPIATFFDGKPVRVGQTLKLPKELARDLLGFAATGNSVSQFSLKLIEVRPAEHRGQSPQAIFGITLKAEDPEQSGVAMTLTGQMAMEVETCRTLAVSLSGPVEASEMHGPAAGQYELHSQGKIEVAVRADYVSR